AILEREQIRQLRPQYIDNLMALGRLYQQKGELEKNRQLQLQAAQLYLDILDEAEKTLKITETFIKLNGEDIEALTLHAQALKKLHRLEEAATKLALLAQLEEKQGNLDRAIMYLEETLNLSIRRFEEREQIIRLLLQKGDTAHATEHLFILAQLYETNNRIPEAAATYERIINFNPENLVAHQRLFEIYLFLENKEKALEHLLWLADHHQQRAEVEKAEQLLIQGVKLHPDSLPLHQRLTDIYESSGNKAQAAVHQLKMAELYLMSGDIPNAILCLEKVRSYQPENMETRRSLALLYLRQERLNDYVQEMLTVISIALEQGLVNESEKYVQDLLTITPDDMLVRDKIAHLYLQNKIPEMAVRQYLELAQILLNRNQFDPALQAIDKVIALDPNNITARELLLEISIQQKNLDTARKVVNELVGILVAQRRTEKAISILQQALKTFTEEVNFREQLAQFLEKINRTIDAIVEWRKLAETCIRLDKLEKAASIYKHISEILPDDTRAVQDYIDIYSRFGAELELIDDYLNLIQKFVKRGAFLEAEQTFQRLLKIAPQDIRVLENYTEFLIHRKELDKLFSIVDQLSDIYMQSGDLRNAEKILQRAVSVLPRKPELHLKLADVLLLLNTKGRAVEELKYAAQLYACL
ncbi:MAG: tetratricopeptide repeat protein, partial [Candidatus Sumerlaeia bacterium]|nr:tetratricopeptide repeat protein [Candidatus Sumerlaeia bacterium]